MESSPRRTSSTATNALKLLKILAQNPSGIGVSESAHILGIGRSSAHLLLSTLESQRFATGSASGVYKLGIAAFEVGATLPINLKFDESRLEGMRALADRSGEAVSISIQAGTDALILKRLESTELLRAEIKVGTRMPLHASASGKVLLAAMTNESIKSLYPMDQLPHYPYAILEGRPELMRHLETVRQMGFALNTNEFTHGVIAIACPVRDENGLVIAAMSIAGPTNRFDPQSWLPDLQAAAKTMFSPNHSK